MTHQSSPGTSALIQQWRGEAKRHREAEAEAAGNGDEEAFLHGVEADRLEKCAAELAGLAQPSTSPDPEAWMRDDGSAATINPMIAAGWKAQGGRAIPLYAAPQAASVAQAQSSDRITQAIRDYCISLGSPVQLSSDGVERIYYSGISIVGLADAILTNAAPANRSTAKATANVGDNGERMGSEPAMGIVTGGSDPTPSMMSSTDSAAYAAPGVHEIAREAYANGFADGKLAHNSPPATPSTDKAWEDRRVDETGPEYEGRIGKLVTGTVVPSKVRGGE